MHAKKFKDVRRRLSSEYEHLIKSINRGRLAAEEIKMENTEDEGDWPQSATTETSSIICTKATTRA